MEKLYCPDCWAWQQKITEITEYTTGPLGAFSCPDCAAYLGRVYEGGSTRMLWTMDRIRKRMHDTGAKLHKMQMALEAHSRGDSRRR
jgi:hypothetical protein